MTSRIKNDLTPKSGKDGVGGETVPVDAFGRPVTDGCHWKIRGWKPFQSVRSVHCLGPKQKNKQTKKQTLLSNKCVNVQLNLTFLSDY